MERIRRPRGSGHVKYSGPKSATGILVAIFGILAVIIVAAIFFAPRKPPPPAASSITYQNKPKEVANDSSDNDDDRPARFNRGRRHQKKEAPPPPKEQSTGRYQIFGSVKEFKTGKAISGAQIHCELLGIMDQIAALRKDNPKWNDEVEKQFQALDEDRRKNSARVQSDEQGNYTLRVDKAGEFLFRVWATGYIRLEDKHLTIKEDSESNHMDFEMSTGASISGRITESGSQKGAQGVTIDAEGPPPYRNNAQSDEDGKYTVAGLGPGEFTVTLRLKNCPYIVTGVIPTKNVTIRSETQEIRGIDFTVDAAGTVWGYVTSRDGTPVKGVDVVLCTSASVFSQFAEASLKQAPPLSSGSKDDGYYELIGVPLNKEWKLYAMSKDKAPQLTSPFILTPNQRTARIDVFISPGTTVYGRVVDTKRTPIADAEVICIPAYSKFFSPLDSPQAFRNQKSDKDGLFQLLQLPVGEYQVMAQKRGYKFAAMGEPIYPDGFNDITGVEVTLSAVETGQFTVYGNVADASGKPIKDVALSLGSVGTEDFSSGESNTTSDAQGNFTFQGVQSGLVMLRAEKPGYQGQNLADVKLDGPTNIVMQAGATLKGTVVIKESGSPAAGAMVRAIRVSGGSGGGGGGLDFLNQGNGGSATTDASGSFSMEIDAGSYIIEARAQGLAPGRSTVTIEAGQSREDLVIYVRKDGARIQGRLTLADGRSPAGALVWLSEGDNGAVGSIADIGGMGGQQRGIQVGSDGTYEFTNLAAGTYSVYGRMETYAQGHSVPVDLGDGQSSSGIDVLLSAGGALEGSVMVKGIPQPGALVTVIGENFVREPTAADQSGHYRVEQIPAGNYLATATPINGGNITSILSPMSARVQITEGMTTPHNFGEPTNTALIGTLEPAPAPGMRGVAVLLAPGVPFEAIPSMGILPLMSWLSSNLDKFVGEASVDPDGTFRIDNLVAGEYTLVVVLGNVADVLTGGGNRQAMARVPVTIVDGQQIEVPVPLNSTS